MGRLMKNTEFHAKRSSSRPPSTGPMPTPSPKIAAQSAMACGRSWFGKVAVMIDSVAGKMNALPIASTPRVMISMVVLVEAAAATENSMNQISPN